MTYSIWLDAWKNVCECVVWVWFIDDGWLCRSFLWNQENRTNWPMVMRACEKCRYFVISITITREETRECVFYVCLYGTHCFSSKLNCICCINCRSNLVFILFFFYIINQNKTKQKTNQQQKHKQTKDPMCLRFGQVSQNKDDDKKYIYSGQTNIYVNRFLL